MKYAGIINNDVVNGYDVCVSYWCQGCVFHCPGCHNPQTWDFGGGMDANEDELINYIQDAIALNGIQRNLSILGGEPLCDENIEFTHKLINSVKSKYPTIMIFLWTGYIWEDILSRLDKYTTIRQDILENINVLIDGRFDINLRDITLPFRGSKNQRVIDVKKSLETNNIIILTRGLTND